MRQRLLTICLVCLLCGVAVVPFLHNEAPCSNDGALHFFRIAAMRRSLGQGLLFSRWLPDVAFGYGIPFFNYRAPLSYYVVLGVHLVGLPLPLTQNLVYVLTSLGGALGMYLFVKDLLGERAAIVAAVAYAYAPYRFVDTIFLAIQPEAFALALLPFVLWSFRRLALEGTQRWFLRSTGSLTALYLSHNISSLLFTPLLIAYVGVLWWVYRDRGRWTHTVLAFLFPVGLTIYFWLPALAERSYVQLYLSHATRQADFHHNFLSVGEIFAFPKPVDASLMNPPLEVTLGTAQAAFAGLGLLIAVFQANWGERNEQQATVLFFAATTLVLLFMSTQASVWLWEHVPLLRFVQFPWRFVGRATLPVAVLAGATMLPLPRHAVCCGSQSSRFALRVSRALPSVVVSILIIAALPSTYPPRGYCPRARYPTVQDVHHYEHNSGLVGVDPEGAYLPIWAQHRPQGSPLELQYAAEGLVARLDESTLPEEAQILQADYSPNRATMVVQSPEPFHARYLSFYFPGWRVWVDEEQVRVMPSEPEGLITFNVPAGRRTIRVRFGETPLRRTADVVSALVLLTLVASILSSSRTEPRLRPAPPHSLTRAPLFLAAGLLLILKLVVFDRTETPIRHAGLRADGTLPGVEHLLSQPYADGMKLIGYDQGEGTMPSDGTLRVDLYWTVQHKPSRRYQTVVHLVGSEGLRWSLKDTFRPTDYKDPPTTRAWHPGRYALDSHEVVPLTGTPSGTYDIVLTLFDRDSLTPLSVLNEEGQPVAPELVLGQVRLAAPRDKADPDAFDLQHRLDRRLGPVTLLGVDFSRSSAAPGDPVLINTFWRSDTQPATDLELGLTLLAADGSRAASYEFPPTAPWHPTSAWKPGDVWRGQHLIHLPADLNGGEYWWQLSLLPMQRPADLPGVLKIDAPERTFTPPPVDSKLGAQVGHLATLVGASFEPAPSQVGPGETLTTTLVWRVESSTYMSYRVFLHLIGPDGKLVDQSDGIPVNWSRPTTGWLPGEYIIDPRSVTLPPGAPDGQYIVLAGLYASGGDRLVTPSGADAAQVLTITLQD